MDQHKEERPTPDELYQGWLEGGSERLGQLMIRADGKRLVPSPKDLFLAWGRSGKELLDALMSNMGGTEPDDSEPEFDERRWR